MCRKFNEVWTKFVEEMKKVWDKFENGREAQGWKWAWLMLNDAAGLKERGKERIVIVGPTICKS